jgi:hypothetical protein
MQPVASSNHDEQKRDMHMFAAAAVEQFAVH